MHEEEKIMKKISVFLGIFILTMMTLVLSGCSKPVVDFRFGVYQPDEGFASLIIEEDETFTLTKDVVSSYAPSGSYTISGDELLLEVDDELQRDTIKFKIKGDRLIFKSGKLVEDQIVKGTEFLYVD